MTLERKKMIYAIAVKYDVIIVEDDRESSPNSLGVGTSSFQLTAPVPDQFVQLTISSKLHLTPLLLSAPRRKKSGRVGVRRTRSS